MHTPTPTPTQTHAGAGGAHERAENNPRKGQRTQLTTDLDGRLELQQDGLLHENVPRLHAEHLNLRL